MHTAAAVVVALVAAAPSSVAPAPDAADPSAGVAAAAAVAGAPEPKVWTLEALQAAAQLSDPRVVAAAANAALARIRAAEPSPAPPPVPLPSPGVELFELGPPPPARPEPAPPEPAPRHPPTAAQVARARAARDAAEIYWDYQLARRGLLALDDAEKQLSGARDRVDRLAAEGSKQASRQDVAQMDLVRAELLARRAQTAAARDIALEAARAVAGVAADAPFSIAPGTVEPPLVALAPLGRYVEVAQALRPELSAARDAVRARELELRAQRRLHQPELMASGPGAGTSDPYRGFGAALGEALRGKPGRRRPPPAAVAEAEARLDLARADAEAAERAVRVEVARAHGGLRVALDRVARMREEEAAAQRWLAQAELAFDAGKVDAQNVLVPALATARAGAERLSAARDAHVALADLTLAVGEDARSVK